MGADHVHFDFPTLFLTSNCLYQIWFWIYSILKFYRQLPTNNSFLSITFLLIKCSNIRQILCPNLVPFWGPAQALFSFQQTDIAINQFRGRKNFYKNRNFYKILMIKDFHCFCFISPHKQNKSNFISFKENSNFKGNLSDQRF